MGSAQCYRLLVSILLCISTFRMVSAQNSTNLVEVWTATDVGHTGIPGKTTYNATNDTFTIVGSGVPISDSNQGFQFLNQPLQSNFRLTSRILSFQNPTTNGLSGILIRQNTSTNYSSLSYLALTGKTNIVFGGDLKDSNYFQYKVRLPQWLRIVRKGSSVQGFRSDDGKSWNSVGSRSIWGSGTYPAGLAVSSQILTSLSTSRVDQIKIEIDHDGDGLYDDEEKALGTDPYKSDTDGDGYSDYQEVRELFTNPLVKDLQTQNPVSITGSKAQIISGVWLVDGTGIRSSGNTIRGSLNFSASITQADVYEIQVQGKSTTDTTHSLGYPLVISVDGQRIQKSTLTSTKGSVGSIKVISPWLRVGTHTITIEWDNAAYPRWLTIVGITLRSFAGTDSNGNNIKDWIDKMFAAQNAITVAPETSYVSPVCIEGIAEHFKSLSVSGATVYHGVDHNWYANVALATNQTKTIKASFENGAYSQSRTISWKPTNVFNSNDLVLRSGDSLLLTMQPDGTANAPMEITIGSQILSGDSGTPIPYKFSTSGTFLVTAKYLGTTPVTKTINVKVVYASFPSNPIGLIQLTRTWKCSSVFHGLAVEADSRMAFEEVGFDKSSTTYGIKIDTDDKRYVVARLYQGGPIVASRAIQGVGFYSGAQTGCNIIRRLSDGTKVVKMGVVITSPIPDLKVEYDIFSAGATFEDGTRVFNLTSTDFNADGVSQVLFYVPAGPTTKFCHHTKIYQGTELIGYIR